MQEDLADAQASVDWAISQLPSLSQRIDKWLGDNVDVGPKEAPAPETHNRIILLQKAALPLSFNVETGAYLNAMRSSLDLLATALARRFDIPRPDHAYFPVARSEADFARGNYKGHEFVNALPSNERGFIEALKPYQGGNRALWMLHQLDIMRKHRRLLAVGLRPTAIYMTDQKPLPDDFVPVAVTEIRPNEETVMGLIRKGAPDYEMKFTTYVTISEPGLIERKPLGAVLNHLANHCEFIIKLFD